MAAFLSPQKSNCTKKYIYISKTHRAKSSESSMNRREIYREIIKTTLTLVVVIPFFIMAKELCRIYYYSPRVFHAIYALRPPRKLYVIHHGAVQLSIPRRRLIALLAADNYRLASLADVVSFLSLRTEVSYLGRDTSKPMLYPLCNAVKYIYIYTYVYDCFTRDIPSTISFLIPSLDFQIFFFQGDEIKRLDFFVLSFH